MLITIIVLLAFNVPALVVLAAVSFAERLNNALKEKTPTGENAGVTSYSRVTGALGAVILTAFSWALGNVVLAHALTSDGVQLIERR